MDSGLLNLWIKVALAVIFGVLLNLQGLGYIFLLVGYFWNKVWNFFPEIGFNFNLT
jgi:hypothetical protein